MQVGVVRETFPGERRVALVPADVKRLVGRGWQVRVESGAGQAAGFADPAYAQAGATLASRADASACEVLVRVRCLGASGPSAAEDAAQLRPGQLLIGLCDPLGSPQMLAAAAPSGGSVLALELIPRTTRAQAMDVLSSMTTLAGYRAVLLAAVELPRIFPLLMTAAGTLTPARVLVLGAGVAGLSAIATAKRLGAVVRGYDVRPACKEQVESLGARFVELPLAVQQAEAAGGYAAAQDEAFYQRQRELLADVVAENDVVITTAAIPGRPSPRLITADAVARMPHGAVIVDLAAERGGNCELTQADQRVVTPGGVTILGPTNLPSEVPFHASQMFSANVTALLQYLVRDGRLHLDREDEIIGQTLAVHEGQVVHPQVRRLLSPPEATAAEAAG
jgi:NAD(P) transhydrogenase subunit alpha